MKKHSLAERDICRKFILPAVKQAGWDMMLRVCEWPSLPRAAILRGMLFARGSAKKADVVLRAA